MSSLRDIDLRPETPHTEYKRLISAERAAFLDRGTGRPRADLSVDIPCPLCYSMQYRPSFEKDGFTFVNCKECGLFYVTPRLRKTVIESFYRKSAAISYFQEHILVPTSSARKEHIFVPRFAYIQERVPDPGKLLDVGCGTGQFLEIAHEKGWQPYGVELNEFAVRYARDNFGFPIYDSSMESIDLASETFGVVTLWEVVAHLFDPPTILRECWRVLSPGGFLFLSTPNISGFEYRVLGSSHPNLDGLFFLNHFTPAAIQRLLEQAGFRDVEITTPGRLDVDNVVKAVRERVAPPLSDGFLADLLLSEEHPYPDARAAFQQFLARHKLSGHMVVVARKGG